MAAVSMADKDPKSGNKLVKTHLTTLVIVCTVFGIINIVTGSSSVGIGIILMGILTFILITALKNKSLLITRGIIMSQIQISVIILMSIAKHELHAMFPLMLASMSIAAVYYSKKNLIIHWILMDAAGILGIFFREMFYSSAEMGVIIKGILGINIGAFLLMYLVNCSLNFINDADKAKEETNALLEEVQTQAENTEQLLDDQRNVVSKIADSSRRVSSSSTGMLEISDRINRNALAQKKSIDEISDKIASIADETSNALNESKNAADAAAESTDVVIKANEEMDRMLAAMDDITESSKKIESIISTIDSIAFQTNILALNAAVEAARAGEAGKGFAVVADEVKNLSGKSAEAVSSTAKLIEISMKAVENGTNIAKETAENLQSVLKSTQVSETHSKLIANLTKSQLVSIDAVREQIEQISELISENTDTSVKSADIAKAIADESANMNKIAL